MSGATIMARELELHAAAGHARAVGRVCRRESLIAPVFARRSERENARTDRIPRPLIGDDWPSAALETGLRRFARFERIPAKFGLRPFQP
jgi:hypothetical protein